MRSGEHVRVWRKVGEMVVDGVDTREQVGAGVRHVHVGVVVGAWWEVAERAADGVDPRAGGRRRQACGGSGVCGCADRTELQCR